ncbi:hypothetical protein [Planococcus antarcticus]|uniref:hypothetical protein n=1 Tax=Planococcus antarcticus TaxID=161360 RepID=UPI001EE36A48|nr:hypothetical protein [Planococcus antarcticus]
MSNRTYSKETQTSKKRRVSMQSFTWLFIIVGTIVLIAMVNSYFNWWLKSIIVIYYGVLSFLFIVISNRINEKYSGIAPVPEAYWDKNSQWAYTASNLFLLPFIAVLL